MRVQFLQDTLKKYTLLISLQPVISALAGNVGLQTMSTITTGLPLGLFEGRRVGRGVWHELVPGLAIASLLSLVVGGISFAWYSPGAAGHRSKVHWPLGLQSFWGSLQRRFLRRSPQVWLHCSSTGSDTIHLIWEGLSRRPSRM